MTDHIAALTAIATELVPGLRFSSPGLYHSHEQWRALADKLRDPFFQDLHQRNLLAIDHLAAECNGEDVCDVPIELGADPGMYGYPGVWPSRVLKNLILRNVAAWYVTSESRYLDRAIRAMDECCQRPHEWHPDAEHMGLHGANLHTGDLLFALSFGLDALMPHLSQEQSARYIACLVDHGLAAYQKGIDEHDWWVDNCYNWNPSLHANACVAALVLLPFHRELAQGILMQAIPKLGHHLHKYLQGGGYSEGPMYQCTAIGHLSDFVIAWHRATGNDLGLSQHQGFIDTLKLWPYLVGGDGRPLNVSNCGEFSVEYGIAQVAWWARQLDMPEILGYHHHFLRPWQNTHQLFYDVEFFWHQAVDQPVGRLNTKGLKHFPEIDWLSYQHDGLWLFITAGWNGGGHHNQDQGHLILGLGRDRFLCDPGYGQSSNDKHNTVQVRGQNSCANAICPISRLDAWEHGFYACVDLRPAFPNCVSFFNRHFLVVDKSILIIDDAAGARKTWSDQFIETSHVDARWFWQTRLPTHIDGRVVRISGRHSTLRMEALSAIGAIEQKSWHHDGPLRTIHWREHHNLKRSIHPTLLGFDDSPCLWDVLGQEHRFRFRSATARFTAGAHGLEFRGWEGPGSDTDGPSSHNGASPG